MNLGGRCAGETAHTFGNFATFEKHICAPDSRRSMAKHAGRVGRVIGVDWRRAKAAVCMRPRLFSIL